MSGFGTNPTTTTQPVLPTNQFPLSSVAVPGTASGDLTALEGGPASTDSNGNNTAPASMYVKDGSDLTQGTTTDAAATTDVAATISAKLRGLVKISGDIWDSTNHRIRVDGSGVTQPISAASLPLPSGAATSAKQPALGTAGTASSDVLTVQGIASMTALKVDGSGVTQPVSGTITANAGSNLNTSLLALESGGNLATLAGAVTSAKVQANIAQISGATPQMDNTHVLGVSLYGKNSTAGDTPLAVNSNGRPLIIGDFTEQASLSAGSLNADLVPATDMSAFRWVSLHIKGTWSGFISFQISNDNVDWGNFASLNYSGSFSVYTGGSFNGIFYGSIGARYFRARMTSYSSGTAQATMEAYADSPVLAAVGTQANIQLIGGSNIFLGQNTKANSLPVTMASDQGSSTGNAVQSANTAGNVIIKGSAGYLWSAVVTTTGTAQLDIYDNASTNSGTKLLSIPTNAPVASIYAFPGGARASNGIVSNGVSNCPAVTFYFS